MKDKRLLVASAALLLGASTALAQEEGGSPPAGPTSPPGGDTQINVVPGPSQTTTTYQQGPGHGELDDHLLRSACPAGVCTPIAVGAGSTAAGPR